MATEVTRRRFTVDEYHRMGEAGILDEDERVELIDGEIVEMTPIGNPHAAEVDRLTYVFSPKLGGLVIVRVQSPISLSLKDSEPQPDVTLLRPRSDFYSKARPEPRDVLLVVEVMDTSVERDRRIKLPLYARAGIYEVWLVDLKTARVEVYRHPALEGYRDTQILERADSLTVEAFPDVSFTGTELLG